MTFSELCGILIYLHAQIINFFTASILTFYLLFFTKYWWAMLLYIIWIVKYDSKTPERGGRPVEWMRNLKCWADARDYFPIKLVKTFRENLSPEKNYLFCCFPHGLLSLGVVISMCMNRDGFKKLFPLLKPFALTLNINFKVPFHREIALALGAVSVSKKSMNYLLGKESKGNIAAVIVGGAQEALLSKPGTHKVIVKRRRGFVKVALQNGTPLVPVYSFGETDIYGQVNNQEGTLMRAFQEKIKSLSSVSPIIPVGRWYSIIPKKRPITVVGKYCVIFSIHEGTLISL